MIDYSNPLKILMIEDDPEVAESLLALLGKTAPADLASGDFDGVLVQHVTNQEEADEKVAAQNFDIILLDLNYPAKRDEPPASPDVRHQSSGYQGMKWLPRLRQLQLFATIVIRTTFTEPQNVIKALRGDGADDFIGKNGQEARFSNVKQRIQTAWIHAQLRRRVREMEKEFSFLIRTLAARTVAEDIGTLLRQTNNSLNNVARQLESGDASLLPQAANTIKAQFNHLLREFDGLMKLLVEGDDRQPNAIDVGELVTQMLNLYEFRLKEAGVKPPRVLCPDRVVVETYASNLKLALHETIINALDALNADSVPSVDKELMITVTERDRWVTVKVTDNGPGFSDEAIQQLYKRHRSAKGAGHLGMGLYIAKRMMNHLGGEIEVVNRLDGAGSEVTLTFKDLGNYENRNGDN